MPLWERIDLKGTSPQARSFPFSSAAARRLLYLPGQKQQCQRLKQVISLFLTGLFRASDRGKRYGSGGRNHRHFEFGRDL